MRRLPHELGTPGRAGSLVRRLRPFALPALTVVIAIWLFTGNKGYDAAAVQRDFREGRPEAALARLARAPAVDLPAMLTGMQWWPREQRTRALSDLEAVPDRDVLEDATQPTILRPLDKLLQAPAEMRLREPSAAPLTLTLTNTDMNLEVASIPLPAGADRLALNVPLIQGTTCMLTLTDEDARAQRALAGFTWVSPSEAQAVTNAMTAAHDLAGDSDEGARLLTALVALQHGFTLEALDRFAPLRARPGYERLATELSALALSQQGLELSARRMLAN